MISLTVLIAAIAACSLARPPGDIRPEPIQLVLDPARYPRFKDILGPYSMPRYVGPSYPIYVDQSVVITPLAHKQQPRHDYDWLSKEIDRLSISNYDEETNLGDVPHDGELPVAKDTFEPSVIFDDSPPHDMPNEEYYLPYGTLSQKDFFAHLEHNNFPEREISPEYPHDERMPVVNEPGTLPAHDDLPEKPVNLPKIKKQEHNDTNENKSRSEELNKAFALTPYDSGFYDGRENKAKPNAAQTTDPIAMKYQGAQQLRNKPGLVFEERRQTRQNPLLNKNKNLHAGDLEALKSSVTGDGSSENNLQRIPLTSGSDNPTESIYWVTFMAIVGGAFAFAVFGFAFGWYLMMTKKAKAAADVDYPGYGVTGPSVDLTGDRKLAHSAHMYHYQHQKQQIIAMGRNGTERHGSVSDPESEEENEEGDYTVYECPGFASTGNMEVKNPMYSEEPTPITPIKMEIVKPQPKD